jgi:hypothetical protein
MMPLHEPLPPLIAETAQMPPVDTVSPTSIKSANADLALTTLENTTVGLPQRSSVRQGAAALPNRADEATVATALQPPIGSRRRTPDD